MHRPYPVFYVTEKAEKSLRAGHPWVFGEEVTDIRGAYAQGDIVDVKSQKGAYLGSGFVNDTSKIRIRVISTNTNDRFDRAFWGRRIRYAISYRQHVMGNDFRCCRLIFGESDQFPGLVVDRFNDVLVIQTMCLGIERIKDMIFELLLETLREMGETIHAIYERCDVATREKEGLSLYKSFYMRDGLGLHDDLDGHVEIVENHIKFDVNYIEGQKTGYFLDQKYNRRAIQSLARGRKVLDCFTHTGSFALHAAAGGASHVTAVDISSLAIAQAKENARRNSIEADITFVVADVFKYLDEHVAQKSRAFDFIILDPPAFTKSHATARNAYFGYKDINFKAMKLLPRGGYLATCSCSHFMKDEMFQKMVLEAAAEAGVLLRLVEARQQCADHPILMQVPETNYLKFYIFQVI